MSFHTRGRARLAWLIFAASGAGRLLGIALYIWLAVWPILGARGSRPAPSPARAA